MVRLAPLFLLFLLGLPAGVHGQGSETYRGEYSTVQNAVDTVRADDGSMTLSFTYRLTQIPEDPESPFAHMIGWCWGTAVLEGEGMLVGGGGACHLTDGQGNGYWQWWHQDDTRSESCPIRCGSYGDFGGYGRFEGYSSQGEWNMLVLFPAGGGFGRATATFEWR